LVIPEIRGSDGKKIEAQWFEGGRAECDQLLGLI